MKNRLEIKVKGRAIKPEELQHIHIPAGRPERKGGVLSQYAGIAAQVVQEVQERGMFALELHRASPGYKDAALRSGIKRIIRIGQQKGEISFQVCTNLVQEKKGRPPQLTGKAILFVYNPDDPRVQEAVKNFKIGS